MKDTGDSSWFKKAVSATILVCFIITNISPAYGQNQIGYDPSIHSNIDPDKYKLRPDELSQEEVEEARRFLEQPTQYTLEIMFLLKNLYYRIQMEEQRIGVDAIAKMLEKRQDSENIEFEVEKVGKAELIVINTKRGPLFITKVRHNALRMSILFIDKNQVDLQLLEETERILKLPKAELNKLFEGYTPEQREAELAHRRLLLNHIRTLNARMLMSEWNPQLEYRPLSELHEQSKPRVEAPPDVEQKVKAVLNEPISELKNKGWFKKLSSRSYDTWVDLAKQNNVKPEKGNQALMISMYDGLTGDNTRTSKISRDSVFTYNYWKTYWKAIWERPAYSKEIWESERGLGKMRVLLTGDYLMGISFGVALGGLSFLTSLALPNSLPEGLTATDVAQISFGWSLFFGVFSKTWQNFVYRGNNFVRFVKNWSTGLGQSYHFNLVSDESLAVIKNSTLDKSAIKVHTDILINQSIKSSSKTSLQEIPRFRARTGEAQGTLKIKDYRIVMPWKHNMKFMEFEVVENTIDPLKFFRWVRNQFTITQFDRKPWEDKLVMRFSKDVKIKLPWMIPFQRETDIPRKNFEGQTPQFVTTPVGLLSRFGYTVAGIPVGHILYAALAPIGEVRQIRYKITYADDLARKLGEEHALTRRTRQMVQEEIARWNSFKIFNIPMSQFVGYYVKVVPRQIYETTRELSRWLATYSAQKTYAVYEHYQEAVRQQTHKRAESERAQARFSLLNTVQTANGAPHPRQYANGMRDYRSGTCSRLFQ